MLSEHWYGDNCKKSVFILPHEGRKYKNRLLFSSEGLCQEQNQQSHTAALCHKQQLCALDASSHWYTCEQYGLTQQRGSKHACTGESAQVTALSLIQRALYSGSSPVVRVKGRAVNAQAVVLKRLVPKVRMPIVDYLPSALLPLPVCVRPGSTSFSPATLYMSRAA